MNPASPAADPYWNTVAGSWNDWGPPLRPGPADIDSFLSLIRRWRGASTAPLQALLLGVTPELALAQWSVPLNLLAIDLSLPMIEKVWPGDVPGQRRALCADWMKHQPEHVPDLVLTDGAPVFFSDPRPLFERVRSLLAPHGAFVFRAFCSPPRAEQPYQVLADARAGRIENFHVLKWRMAMALQAHPREGVVQHAVWQAISSAQLDFASLPQPGFSPAAAATLRFYRDADATLHFPAQPAYAAALREVFDDVQAVTPSGLFGTQCPVFLARRKA